MGNSTFLEDKENGLAPSQDVNVPTIFFAAAIWECNACKDESVHSVDVRISLTGDANMDLQPDSSFAACR